MNPYLWLLLGLLALALALRSYEHPLFQRLGAVAMLGANFLAGWLLLGSVAAGVGAAVAWALLPSVGLIVHARGLTLPLERQLRHRSPPGAQTFPALQELTEEIEGSGFEHVDDTGWDGEDAQQFFRLFYKEDERVQAAICLIDREDLAWYYLSLSSRGRDGLTWSTWNYPFPSELRFAPQWQINRVRTDLTFLELLASHREFLARHEVGAQALEELTAESIPQQIQSDLRTQLAHNLATGVLIRTGASAARYSWRGLLFLWGQTLRELVRFT